MEDKRYFSGLIALFEAGEGGLQPQEVAPLPANSPESNGQPIEQEQQPQEVAAPAEQDAGLADADYMGAGGAGEPQAIQGDQSSVTDKQKLLKLFDLMGGLLDLCGEFEDSIEKIIENGLLDDKQQAVSQQILRRVKEAGEKIEKYLDMTFPTETYERNLYVYVLLRTELIAAVKAYRRSLGLDRADDDAGKSVK
jgi:hypothetical protein